MYVLRSLLPQAVRTRTSPNPSMAFADQGVMEKKFAHRPVRVRELRPGFELYFYTDPFVGKKIHGAEPLLPYMEIDVKSVIVTSHRVCGETERGWINLATDHNRRGEKRLVYYADPCDAPLRVATTAMPPLEDTGETAPSLENTCAQGGGAMPKGPGGDEPSLSAPLAEGRDDEELHAGVVPAPSVVAPEPKPSVAPGLLRHPVTGILTKKVVAPENTPCASDAADVVPAPRVSDAEARLRHFRATYASCHAESTASSVSASASKKTFLPPQYTEAQIRYSETHGGGLGSVRTDPSPAFIERAGVVPAQTDDAVDTAHADSSNRVELPLAGCSQASGTASGASSEVSNWELLNSWNAKIIKRQLYKHFSATATGSKECLVQRLWTLMATSGLD